MTWDPRPAMRLQTSLGSEKNPFVVIHRQMENTRNVYDSVQRESWESCQGSQALLFSVLSPWGYSIAEQMGIPCAAGMLHPLERTREFPMQLLPVKTLGGGLNRLSHSLAEHLLQLVSGGEINHFRRTLGLPSQHFPSTLFGLLREKDIPLLCNLSPTVLPRPRDWPERVHMDGYWFLPAPNGWSPPPALTEFLARGDAPVYIGFGSLVSDDAHLTGRLVTEALRKIGRRGVLMQGWGGLASAGLDPQQVLIVDEMPHDWLFERMAAVVHHGGAGTTAAALRAGVPQVIVPHMQDQFYWGRKVKALGVGPAALRRTRLSAAALESALRAVCENPSIRRRASELGGRIRREQGLEKALAVIEEHFQVSFQ